MRRHERLVQAAQTAAEALERIRTDLIDALIGLGYDELGYPSTAAIIPMFWQRNKRWQEKWLASEGLDTLARNDAPPAANEKAIQELRNTVKKLMDRFAHV